MDNIEVFKKKIEGNKVLTVYDIFDKSVGDAIEKKYDNRKNEKEYKKIKIPEYKNQNHKFFVNLMKKFIDKQKLWGENTEMTIEYLTDNGWVANLDTHKKGNERALFKLPQNDRENPSGKENNALEPEEQVYIARINVFNF